MPDSGRKLLTMKFSIEYFALLKDQRGCSSETLETDAATPRDLYAQLAEQYAFSLPPESLKVAVNEEFADWNHSLNAGDTVVFIPPVAGG
jgi:molybdopterin converting factor subunit 1|tara:strand:+ start:761 stop:1030 length:270 start_codon:yes stop_codon:yes gene_type:complete